MKTQKLKTKTAKILRTHGPYIRVKTFTLVEVMPFVFTRAVRKKLREDGFKHDSIEWKKASLKEFPVVRDGHHEEITISMGSDRYQLFAEKGVKCVCCGVEGVFFAIEKHWNTLHEKYHLNLYGFDKNGKEIMITKDHIKAVSKGGRNHINNYQTICTKCNLKKGAS